MSENNNTNFNKSNNDINSNNYNKYNSNSNMTIDHDQPQSINLVEDQYNSNSKIDISNNSKNDEVINEDINELTEEETPHRRKTQEIPTVKKRNNTLNVRQTRNNKYLKILVPFDFDLNKFYLSPEDVNIYDFKDYLEEALDSFNSMKEFKIHLDYKATGFRKFLHICFFLFIHIIFGYLTFCLWHLLFFNLVFLMTIVKLHLRFHDYTTSWFTNINNREKIKDMKKILLLENKKELCINKKYTWTCGDHGYWLEMQKSLY